MTNKSQNTIITIDPGANGGIAVFGNGNIQAVGMPKTMTELNEYFTRLKDQFSNITVFIECVQAFSSDDDSGGKKFGINKMLKNYYQTLTVIELQGFRFVEVYPISWQTTLGLKMKRPKGINQGKFKTMRKNLYKEYAQKNFPSVKVNLMTSDALCLIQFVYVKMSDDIEWIRSRLQNKKPTQMKML